MQISNELVADFVLNSPLSDLHRDVILGKYWLLKSLLEIYNDNEEGFKGPYVTEQMAIDQVLLAERQALMGMMWFIIDPRFPITQRSIVYQVLQDIDHQMVQEFVARIENPEESDQSLEMDEEPYDELTEEDDPSQELQLLEVEVFPSGQTLYDYLLDNLPNDLLEAVTERQAFELPTTADLVAIHDKYPGLFGPPVKTDSAKAARVRRATIEAYRRMRGTPAMRDLRFVIELFRYYAR